MRRLVSVILLGFLLVWTHLARAQGAVKGGGPTQILALDVEEGLEEQADALGIAFRARVKASSSVAVVESSTSVGMMGAALKCPSHPDAACLQKIGDHLKTDHFYWGAVSKAGKGQVTGEVHLWARGKPDGTARETYSDAWKDPKDENLERVAARLFDKLHGTSTAATVGTGTLRVQAQGVESGDVYVNDVKRGELHDGELVLHLASGSYDVALRAPGYQPTHKQAAVTSGQDSVVGLVATRALAGEELPPPEKEHHGAGRRIVGWGLVGVGVVAGVVAVVEGVHWAGLQSKVDDARGSDGNFGVPRTAQMPSVDDPCNFTTANAQSACDANKQAKTSSIVAWVAGGVGVASLGVGTYLLLTDKGSHESSPSEGASARPRVVPYAVTKSGGLRLDWTF